jgi:hypothetical protein
MKNAAKGVGAMKRLCLLFCALAVCLGCATEGDKGQWDDFWKDVRGDNMQMRGFSGGTGAANRAQSGD